MQPLVPGLPGADGYDAARFVDHVAELEAIGVTGIAMFAAGGTRAEVVDATVTFGDAVIGA